MKTKNSKKTIKVYGLLGRFFCACAGGIIGFIVGGFTIAAISFLVGALAGFLIEKGIINPTPTKKH